MNIKGISYVKYETRGHPTIPEGLRPEGMAGRPGSQDKKIRKPKLENERIGN